MRLNKFLFPVRVCTEPLLDGLFGYHCCIVCSYVFCYFLKPFFYKGFSVFVHGYIFQGFFMFLVDSFNALTVPPSSFLFLPRFWFLGSSIIPRQLSLYFEFLGVGPIPSNWVLLVNVTMVDLDGLIFSPFSLVHVVTMFRASSLHYYILPGLGWLSHLHNPVLYVHCGSVDIVARPSQNSIKMRTRRVEPFNRWATTESWQIFIKAFVSNIEICQIKLKFKGKVAIFL